MIKDLKELKQLLLLCRKQGVVEINLDGCHIKLGELPREHVPAQEISQISDELTDEQLMFYSVDGVVNEN